MIWFVEGGIRRWSGSGLAEAVLLMKSELHIGDDPYGLSPFFVRESGRAGAVVFQSGRGAISR